MHIHQYVDYGKLKLLFEIVTEKAMPLMEKFVSFYIKKPIFVINQF